MRVPEPSRPLLTFAIAALNQEPFIREAVEAAFAQTYSPLEIVLSDDHSDDRTFEIMKEMAAAYRGPHKIILNQNPKRRCIGGHINRVIEISHGELIVGAAGDDVSLPDRARIAYETWEQSGRRATSIHSNFIQVDEKGLAIEQRFSTVPEANQTTPLRQTAEIAEYIRTLEPVVFGCSHTFSRELFRKFGNLPESLIHEDTVLGLRSLIVGQIIYLPEPLVKYRVHGNNIYATSGSRGRDLTALEREEARLGRYFANRLNMFEAFPSDLKIARSSGLISDQQYERALARVAKMRSRYDLYGRFLLSSFFGKCRILCRLPALGVTTKEILGLAKRLLPKPMFIRMRYALAQADSK